MVYKLPEFTEEEIKFSRAQTEYTERKILERFGRDRGGNFWAFIGFWAGLVISLTSLALVDAHNENRGKIFLIAIACCCVGWFIDSKRTKSISIYRAELHDEFRRDWDAGRIRL